jgi:Asp-tRNA(Asn)/Glu-tRNA(Gln) amidotransferase A subunit family amidase
VQRFFHEAVDDLRRQGAKVVPVDLPLMDELFAAQQIIF